MSSTGDGTPLNDGSMERTSYDRSGAADVLEPEPVPMLDGLSPDSTVGSAHLELDGRSSPPDFEMPNAETNVSFNELPKLNGRRTKPDEMQVEHESGSSAPEDAVEAVDSGVGLDGAEVPIEHVDYQELYDWAVRMFAISEWTTARRRPTADGP